MWLERWTNGKNFRSGRTVCESACRSARLGISARVLCSIVTSFMRVDSIRSVSLLATKGAANRDEVLRSLSNRQISWSEQWLFRTLLRRFRNHRAS